MSIKLNTQTGFTMIELLIVISIISIIAVIATPSYVAHIKNNRQQQAKADMLKVEGELEQWRSRSLSYSGFTPKSGFIANANSSVTTNSFKSPIKSDDKRYEVFLYSFMKGNSGPITVKPIKTSDLVSKWAMFATPINDDTGLNSYLLTSDGVRCSTPKKTDLTESKLIDALTNRNCGIQSGEWK